MGRLRTLLQSQSLKWNFAGNMAGRLWLGVMSLVTVPVFVHLLGTNAFGIVSLVATFQSVLALLDFGLAGTANREVATLRAAGNRGQIADTVRTFEVIYWTVAVVIGLGFAGLSHWLANSWVPKQSLPPADIQMAIILGGISLAARWPVALYTGILQGLERQVLQNGILVLAATTRVGLTILALLFVARTVHCFLVAQALANVMEVLLSGYVARRLAMGGAKGRFNPAVVRRVWRFAVGFNLVGTFGMLVSGTPQLLISKLLPLVELTYYSVACTATGALQVVYLAAQTSLFPRMSACWHQGDLPQMRRLYLSGLRYTVYACVGPAMVLCFFSSEVLTVWTRFPEVVHHVRPLLPILALAILANCATAAPLTVLLASGHTQAPLLVNAISLPFMVAGCYLAIRAFGASGAAACWLGFNLICFGIYGRYCFTRIFPTGLRPLLYGFPLQFLIVGGCVSVISRLLMPDNLRTILLALWLFSTMIIACLVQILALKSEERCALVTTLKEYGLHFRKLFCKTTPSVAPVGL